MVRAPCCEKMGLKRGPWTAEEDQVLINFISLYGHGNWRALPKQAGLSRCGKSCRLRWTNYLRPDIKRGNFTKEEEDAIINLHQMLGNRWSAIAARLPGRTDNEIKNVWHTHLKKRLRSKDQHIKLTKHMFSSQQADDDKPDQPPVMTTSRGESTVSTCYHVTTHSPQPSSSISTDDISSSSSTNDHNNLVGSTNLYNNTTEFPSIDESLIWSEVLPTFPLSPLPLAAGLEHGEDQNDMDQFWYEMFDMCADQLFGHEML